MRIATFLRGTPTLTETFIVDGLLGLAGQGNEVTALALWEGGESGEAGALAEFERSGVRYLGLGRWSGIAGKIALLAGWLPRALLTPCALVRLAAAVARAGGLRPAGEMLRRGLPLAGLRVQCVYAEYGPVAAEVLPVAESLGLPLVGYMHGFDLSFYPRRHPGCYRQLFAGAKLVLTNCEYSRGRLAELGCPEEKLRVVHLGVCPEQIRFQVRSRPLSGPVELLSVGRLTEKKGTAVAVRAVARVIRSGLNVRYTVAGDGPLRGSVIAAARDEGISEAVALLGARSREEVLELLGSAHLFLLPSLTASDGDTEGTPIALMEAMAAGLPVIASRHAGIPEMIDDGKNGLLVPEGDVDGLADAIASLVRAPNLWKRMGEAGRARVESDFNRHNTDRRLHEALCFAVGLRKEFP